MCGVGFKFSEHFADGVGGVDDLIQFVGDYG